MSCIGGERAPSPAPAAMSSAGKVEAVLLSVVAEKTGYPRDVLELDPTTVNALGHHPIRLTDPAGCTSCALCARVCPDTVFTIYARPKVA